MPVSEALDPADVPEPGAWQPLSYQVASGATVTPPLAPHWSLVLPFVLDGPDVLPPPPPAWDSEEHLDEIEELIAISANLSDHHKAIAEYWADGPATELPPGHWNLFAQWVARRDRHALGEDVRLFFALNNALHDAAVVTWEAERHYDYWRPITAIRFHKHGQSIEAWGGPNQGSQIIPGGRWLPFQREDFPAPPFAEYTSGHSAFGAAAETLRRFTGGDAFGARHVVAAGSLLAEEAPAADVTLHWPTFSAAADEAGLSRRYGGIHFRSGDLAARVLGRAIGSGCFAQAQELWSGERGPLWGPFGHG